MTIEIILLLLLVIVCALLVVMVMLGVIPMGRGRGDSQFRNLFDSQRAGDDYGDLGKAEEDEAFKAAKAASSKKASDSAITIEKKLKWAQWSMNVTLFHSIEAGLSFISFLLGTLLFGPLVLLACLSVGPITMRALLNRAVENRFLSFDKDYPSFLLSLVGLLKTGMNPMSAIEAASKGMEEHSLVKQEVDVMLERLRYGVPEDQSIGSFAEDIYHPEVELFVQALLLSRAVGGTLSDTLDRLARQVRKRQYFRRSAKAAVGMQRGSIWFILGIMGFIEGYLWYSYPEIIEDAMKDPTGWQVWQVGITLILFGMFWVNQITKIKV